MNENPGHLFITSYKIVFLKSPKCLHTGLFCGPCVYVFFIFENVTHQILLQQRSLSHSSLCHFSKVLASVVTSPDPLHLKDSYDSFSTSKKNLV